MKLVPNLGPAMRVLYVGAGVLLVAMAFWAPFSSRLLAVIVGLLGVAAVVEGAIGF